MAIHERIQLMQIPIYTWLSRLKYINICAPKVKKWWSEREALSFPDGALKTLLFYLKICFLAPQKFKLELSTRNIRNGSDFFFLREGETRGGAEEERILSRLHAQHRAWPRTWSHNPEIFTWAETRNRTLKWLSHPSALRVILHSIDGFCYSLNIKRTNFWCTLAIWGR